MPELCPGAHGQDIVAHGPSSRRSRPGNRMNAPSASPAWIAVDWGNSRLRAWAMPDQGPPLAETSLASPAPEPGPESYSALLGALLSDWITTQPADILACGMLGGRQGWVEVAYVPVPCTPLALEPVLAPDAAGSGLFVRIVPGLCQERPADVMRGEETQIAGALSLHPGFDGIACLPGTHTKWAEVSAREVVSFRSFMTGELFGVLRSHTLLRHATGTGWAPAAFADAVSEALSRPEALAARLFSIRAENLLRDADTGTGQARLSGLLIGAELAAARPYWLGRELLVIGDGSPADRYCEALELQGVQTRRIGGAEAAWTGLRAIRERQQERTS